MLIAVLSTCRVEIPALDRWKFLPMYLRFGFNYPDLQVQQRISGSSHINLWHILMDSFPALGPSLDK